MTQTDLIMNTLVQAAVSYPASPVRIFWSNGKHRKIRVEKSDAGITIRIHRLGFIKSQVGKEK